MEIAPSLATLAGTPGSTAPARDAITMAVMSTALDAQTQHAQQLIADLLPSAADGDALGQVINQYA